MLRLCAELSGHHSNVWSVRWRPSKDTVDLLSCGGTSILLWSKSQFVWTLENTIFNKETLISYSDETTANLPHQVARVDILPVAQADIHAKTIRQIAWAHDGKLFAAASFDSTVSIWRQGSDDTWDHLTSLEGHDSEVKSVAFSIDDVYLASCGRDKTIWIYYRESDVNFVSVAILKGHTQDIKCVKWHPEHLLLFSASYDNDIRIWGPAEYDPKMALAYFNQEAEELEGDWLCYNCLTGHESIVWDLTFDYSGYLLASCSADLTVRFWTAQLQHHFSQIDSTQLLSSMYKQYSYQIIRKSEKPPLQWECVFVLSGYHQRFIYSLAFHPTLNVIATACGDNSIRLFGSKTSSKDDVSWDLLVEIANAHSDDVNSVAWKLLPEDDGTWLLASGGDDHLVKIYKFSLDLNAT